MEIKTIASICTGTGGVEVGAIDCGVVPIWGVDWDKETNAIYEHNFNHQVYQRDLLKPGIDWESLETPDILHISPPCQSYSVANVGGKEKRNDITIATACSNAIRQLRPSIITIENVSAYRNSFAWMMLFNTMIETGYFVTSFLINMADWGVPQNRKRFIAIATKDRFPPPLFYPFIDTSIKDAISDLIPDFEPIESTDGQIDKMRDSDKIRLLSGEECILDRVGLGKYTKVRYMNGKCFTILSTHGTDGKRCDRKSLINYHSKGKFYNLTIRAIARLQGFPDWYSFEGFSNRVAIKAIGNSVPPQFYSQLVKQFL